LSLVCRVIGGVYRRLVVADLRARRACFGMNHLTDRISYCDAWLLPQVLRMFGAQIGDGTVFQSPVFLNAAGRVDYSNLRIGNDCHVGKNVLLDLRGVINIDDRVTISMGTSIITHLDVGRSRLSQLFGPRLEQVRIEDDCYLGANVCVLPDVHIGKCCLIGAGAVVTKDIPERSLAVGMPARVVRKLEASGE